MNTRAICALFLLYSVLHSVTSVSAERPLNKHCGVAGLAEPVYDGDFYYEGKPSAAKVKLGQLLFFDKILSGNQNIACATCHHPQLGSSDAQSLSLGEGAVGLGRERRADLAQPLAGRIPRNSQALYFVGAKAFERLFHDGRLEVDPYKNWPSGFWSPVREQLPAGLDNVLAAQALFPVISHLEMAGQQGENEIADAVAQDRLYGPNGAWEYIARRLRLIPEYVDHFQVAYTDIETPEDLNLVHAANAISAFETVAFRFDDSPFDRYLRTCDPAALSTEARRGMSLFYGRAQCSSCHSGKFQTDQQFHAIAMPQIGPGKGDGWDHSYWQTTGLAARMEDFGRYRVTQNPADKYRFRTPSLRNVELSGPWGHAGAYDSLEAVIQHHLNPTEMLTAYRPEQAELPSLTTVLERTAIGSRLAFTSVNPLRLEDFLRRDYWVMNSPDLKSALIKASELPPVALTQNEISDLVAFLKALTDPRSRNPSDLIPIRVPSGLSIDVLLEQDWSSTGDSKSG